MVNDCIKLVLDYLRSAAGAGVPLRENTVWSCTTPSLWAAWSTGLSTERVGGCAEGVQRVCRGEVEEEAACRLLLQCVAHLERVTVYKVHVLVPAAEQQQV